jgi:dihydrofolate synthase/folylpolyglutamate synthase
MVSDGLEYPTEYEIISAIMYQYFYERHVDYAVVEVAMGGENDCTNVMDHSILSIITAISLDHTGFLGDTLLDIAKEKSGVIKRNSTVILHPQSEDVMEFIYKNADEKMSVVRTFDKNVVCTFDDMMHFEYKGLKIDTQMMGIHQAGNIIGVLEAVQFLKEKGYISVSSKLIQEAIAETVFEGRFERIGEWILDGAHNHESLMALRDVLCQMNLYNLIGVFGALKDKDIDQALLALKPHFDTVIVTEPNSFRKCPADEMGDKLKELGYDIIVESSVEKAFRMAEDIEGTKLGFGSFYMLSELRPYIK